MNVRIDEQWKSVLQEEFTKPYFKQLTDFVRNEYASKKIYPPASMIFRAFDYTPFNDVKVIIIGQDPYHGPHQANGLSFSVREGIALPPSLQNIYKELQDDLNAPFPSSGNLEHWAKQGVLMLNATLTVAAGNAGSHQGKGWETFTDAAIAQLSQQKDHLVFILWGAYAQKKGAQIDRNRHFVINSPHPSPFSADRGFFGSRPFSKTNEYLISKGKTPIRWEF